MNQIFTAQKDMHGRSMGFRRRNKDCSWADYAGSREMGASPASFGVMTHDRQPKRKSPDFVRSIFCDALFLFSRVSRQDDRKTLKPN